VTPPLAGADRWTAELKRTSLFPYLFFSSGDGMRPIIILCLALGLGSGCLATLFHLLIYWETYQKDAILHAENKAFSEEGSAMAMVRDAAVSFESLISSFKFFPSFLQIGYLGYAVSRWRAFQVCIHMRVFVCTCVCVYLGFHMTTVGTREGPDKTVA
jgi:hypothetical protein